MTIASAKLPGTPGWAQLVFFLIAGLLWVIPALLKRAVNPDEAKHQYGDKNNDAGMNSDDIE